MERKDVALAWEGGGAKGAFGVGVMKILSENNLAHFEGVAGSSVGGLNGVMIAAGEIEKLIKIWQEISWRDIFIFNGLSLRKKSLYTAQPLKKLLKKNVTEEIWRKIKDKRIYLTGLNFEKNRLKVYKHFPTREDLIYALMTTSAIPGIFEPQIDESGQMIVDGGLYVPLPFKILLDNGFRKILVILHEPLNLEKWTEIEEKQEIKEVKNLKDFTNRLGELITRNLARKDLEKYFLAKFFEEKLKSLEEKILTKITSNELKEKIADEFKKISFPYQAEIVIISPPTELHDILDFSKKSIQKAIALGEKVGREKLKEVKELFEK